MERTTRKGSVLTTREDIGDIAVSIEHDSNDDSYVVSVFDARNGKPLETLEYGDNRQRAYGEYDMIRSLLKKVAAIHPLISV